MNFSEISFPVYRLRNEKPLEQDGIIFYMYNNVIEDEEDGSLKESVVIRIIDDTKISAASLSTRRLAMVIQKAPLFKLTKAIFFLGDLIKIAKKGLWFIDSVGKIFEYQKTTRVKLKYHKITKLIRASTGGAIVEVEGIGSRFKSLFFPENNKLYAGILHNGMSPILYGFYDAKYKDTWRTI